MIDRRLVTLAVGVFINSTGVMVVIGLLADMAEDLGLSVAALGQINTASSLVVAIGAPLLAVVTSTLQRRHVLVAAMTLSATGALLASFSQSFTLLTLGRMLSAGAVGLYTPQAISTAALLYPPEKRGQALATVMLGMSLANVVGIPLGTWLGAAVGWRTTLLVIGVVAATITVLMARQVPRNLPVAPLDRHSWGELWRDKPVVMVLAFTVAHGLAQFILYMYIAPVLRELLTIPTTRVAMLLATFGAAGVLGNMLSVRFLDRIGALRSVVISSTFILCALLLLSVSRDSLTMATLAMALWGIGSFTMGPAQQARLMKLNPKLATVSIGFNTAGVYAGMAFGSLFGGLLIASMGLHSLNIAAILMMIMAYGVLYIGTRTRSQAAAPR
jgi:predicted MFS family arabinose efflux permease